MKIKNAAARLPRLMPALMLATAAFMVHAQGPALQDEEPPPPQTRVSEVMSEPTEGREIRLRGRLVREMADGVYLFSDDSGSIRIDVNDTALKVDREVSGQPTVDVVGELGSLKGAPPSVRVRSLTVVAPEALAPQ